MAKGNMLLGYSRGKVGSLVFKRQNGQQVTVPRVTPPNPQTHAQMMRRVAFASATKTAKALMGIIDHSFQGVQYGQKSVQHFVKMAAKKAFTGVAAADASTLSAAPFQLAPVLPPSTFGLAAGGEFMISEGDLPSALLDLASEEIEKTFPVSTTAAQFCASLGVSLDSQLTFIMGSALDIDSESEYVMKGINYKVVRINFLSTAGDLPLVVSGNLNPAVIDTERSSSLADIALVLEIGDEEEPEPGEVAMRQIVFFPGTSLYNAMIVSKFEDGKWRRSTESLVSRYGFDHNTQPVFQDNTAFNDLEATIALYKKQAEISREEYLNQEANPM